MAVNSNHQNQNQNQNQNQVNNTQYLQHRLHVREQEINALKVQNRHLLGKIEELEQAAEPNQIDTQFVADEVKRHIDPVVQALQTTLNASFEMIQSTLKGIYQQSQRSQNAVEEMAAHAQGLETRMNEQRKQDQIFYQDKVFAMIGNFCDRLERQIDVRLRSLSVVEMVHSRQNEILVDLETLKAAIFSVQKFSEANRSDIHRIEKTSSLTQQILQDIQRGGKTIEEPRVRAQATAPRVMIQLPNPGKVNSIEVIPAPVPKAPEAVAEQVHSRGDDHPQVSDRAQNQVPHQAVREFGNLQLSSLAKEDAGMILALLRAEKNELKKVARKARDYLERSVSGDSVPESGNSNEGKSNEVAANTAAANEGNSIGSGGTSPS